MTISRPVQQPRHQRRDEAYDPFAGVSGPRSQSAGAGGPQVRMIERVFQEPKKRVGQFTAQTRGGAFPPLAWFDTPSGRWLMSSRAAADGQRWITYAPADNARLAQQLYAQLEGRF